MLIKNCAIIGVGLIGGSLGLAFSERQLADYICGVDVNRDNLSMALAAGAVHRAVDLPEAVSGADLVILATPVGASGALLKEIKQYIRPGAIVTDVGSTKEEIVGKAGEIIGNRFVGGHPMAGAETFGFSGADSYLFENAFYLLTPTSETDAGALDTVRRLVRAVGAVVMEIPPQEHDLVTAAISHLPHFMAVSLVSAVANMPVGDKAMALAAGGFRDTTRIAASSPTMWRDIFLSNREQVLRTLDYMRIAMDELETALRREDAGKIMHILSDASTVRKKLPLRPKGYLPYIYEIVVTVPDRPGIIAGLAGMLGKAGINIVEIEILRAREGYEGTIRVGFAAAKEQDLAMELLQAKGINCRRKV